MQPLSATRLAFLPDRIRLPLYFNGDQLRADLATMPEEAWVDHFVHDNYEGDWSVLPLRAPRGATHPIAMIYSDPGATQFDATPWLDRAPYLGHVLDSLACPLLSARLMRLKPGSVIKPHRDHDLSAALGRARLHIPVVTNPLIDFRLNGTRVDMTPGSVWYLRLSDMHQVRNDGPTDRVHLVVDCVVDDWLADHLLAAVPQGKQASSTMPSGKG